MVLRQPARLVIVLLLVASLTGAAVADHDEHEPNDGFDSASSIATGSYTNLHIADGESDFYAIDLAAGEELTVDVLFIHDDGDLDLTVYDPDHDGMDSSFTLDDDESVTVTADETGTHYVEVYGFSSASNDYHLGIERSGGVTSTPTETPTPTDAPTSTPTDTRTSTGDGTAQGEANDGGDGGDGDQDNISIEVSPGFESWTALVALLAVLAILRRR